VRISKNSSSLPTTDGCTEFFSFPPENTCSYTFVRNVPEGDERKLEKHFMTYDPLGILIDASNHSFL
jgi:hypothetical protein